MLFLGTTFLSGDVMSMAASPTNLDRITNLKLMNCAADDLYVSKEALDAREVPFEWGWDTNFWAQFNGNTSAGNIEWDIESITAMLIKRKRTDENIWTTIHSQEVKDASDLIVTGIDITPTNGTYEYAATCFINGEETAYYISKPVRVDIGELVMIDGGCYDGNLEVWRTSATDGFCDTTNVTPSQVIETMYSKYPTIVSNSITNYQTISVSGNWTMDECDPNKFEDDENRVQRNKSFIRFLTNRQPKVLKNVDGREWLVYVTTPPTDAAQDYYKIRQISFECTEIGDVNSEEDLYDAGIINTSPAYWSYSQ